ncbi:MAG: histidine kinase [Flavobacteriales bacterium]|nr:histidine kinase [Flavobacteriales bacterium]MCB9204622.1 histidine kinase [Flavobacteriales bacterium]
MLWLSAVAQEPVFRTLTEDDGLPTNTVYDMLQASDGTRWFGTSKGLVRYDGRTFRTYTTSGMKGSTCTHLLEGGGRIWCVNFARQIFYWQNDTLQELKDWNGADKDGLLDIDLLSTDTSLIIGCGTGVFRFHIPTANTQLLSDPADSTLFMHQVIVSDERAIAIGPKGWLTYSNGKTERHRFAGEETRFVQTLQLHDGKPHVAFVNESNWSVFEGNTLKETNVPIAVPVDGVARYTLLQLDEDGNQWLTRKEGVFHSSDPSRPLLGGISASKILKDRERQLWVTTLHDGILIIPNLLLWSYPKTEEAIDLVRTENEPLLLTKNGISALGTEEVSVNFPTEINDVNEVWKVPNREQWLISGKQFRVLENGRVASFGIGAVKDVAFAQDQCFIASNEGVWRVSTSELVKIAPERIASGRCLAVLNTERGLLAGFDDALNLVQTDGNTSTIDNSVYVNSISSTASNRVFIGTQGSGLMELVDGKLKSITSPVGFQNIQTVSCEGKFVFSVGDRGILHLNLESGNTTIIDRTDGLPTHDITDMEIHNGRVFMSTSKGVCSFPIDIEAENETPPSIGFRLSNGSGWISSNQTEFTYKQNTFLFDLTTDATRHQGELTFKYRLLGFGDDSWKVTSFSVPGISFANLPAGKYRFEALAVNEDGVESVEPAFYSFTISPPFWQTWWFRLLMFLQAVLVLALLFEWRRRVNAKKAVIALEQSRMKEQLTSYQLKALRAQMNPHFIFNALNTLQRYIMTNDHHAAGEYLGRFSDLMRTFLSLSEKETVTVAEEVETLKLYLDIEKQRMGDEFHYQLDCPEELEQRKLPSMLVQPIVENAIKHGLLHRKGEKRLSVAFTSVGENGVSVTVTDNGIGRERSREINHHRENHQSFGLKSVEERIELINQSAGNASIRIEDLKDGNGQATGTRVILQL